MCTPRPSRGLRRASISRPWLTCSGIPRSRLPATFMGTSDDTARAAVDGLAGRLGL